MSSLKGSAEKASAPQPPAEVYIRADDADGLASIPDAYIDVQTANGDGRYPRLAVYRFAGWMRTKLVSEME
jgi:hypothetical protein